MCPLSGAQLIGGVAGGRLGDYNHPGVDLFDAANAKNDANNDDDDAFNNHANNRAANNTANNHVANNNANHAANNTDNNNTASNTDNNNHVPSLERPASRPTHGELVWGL